MKEQPEIDEDFLYQGAVHISDADVDKTLNKKEKIEEKVTHSGAFSKYIDMIKQMFAMISDYRKGNYTDVPWFTISSLVFVLLYILNPFDVIPDFIPGLGYIDDISVLTLGLKFVETDLHKYGEWKADNDDDESEL